MKELSDEEKMQEHISHLITFSNLLHPNDLVSIKFFEGGEVQGKFLGTSDLFIRLDDKKAFPWDVIASIEIHYPYKKPIPHGRLS